MVFIRQNSKAPQGDFFGTLKPANDMAPLMVGDYTPEVLQARIGRMRIAALAEILQRCHRPGDYMPVAMVLEDLKSAFNIIERAWLKKIEQQ